MGTFAFLMSDDNGATWGQMADGMSREDVRAHIGRVIESRALGRHGTFKVQCVSEENGPIMLLADGIGWRWVPH